MLKVAVIGATGAVGREMIKDMQDLCHFPIELSLFASAKSAGQGVLFNNKSLQVAEYKPGCTQNIDVVLMSAGSEFSRQHAADIVSRGSWVVDNSSAWRMQADIPLIVPEVNPHVLKSTKQKTIIANPNCSTIQMVVALKILHEAYGLNKVLVSTYQSVSGAGQKGIDELLTKSKSQHDPFVQLTESELNISKAYNLVPSIDRFVEGGHCYEEVKMVQETRKIMELPGLTVLATTVRVPVYYSHSESIMVELQSEVTREEVIQLFKSSPEVCYVNGESYEDLLTPRKVQGRREVFVSRVRLPFSATRSNWIQFWNVADNLKKGAATNAVQILIELSKRYN